MHLDGWRLFEPIYYLIVRRRNTLLPDRTYQIHSAIAVS